MHVAIHFFSIFESTPDISRSPRLYGDSLPRFIGILSRLYKHPTLVGPRRAAIT